MAADGLDVLIVGAGIVGAACALELATQRLRVAVVERDTVGSGATAAGMGHLVVMDDSQAQLALTRYGVALWDELVRDEPGRHEYQRCGTIWLAADEVEMEAAAAKQARYHESGVACELLGGRAIYAREPQLGGGLIGGLLVPGDGAIYPPGSAARLMERAQEQGATLLYGEVVGLTGKGAALADGRVIHGERVVLANSTRITDLVPDLPVFAKKGHLAITARYPGWLHHQLVELGYIKRAHATTGDSVAFNIQPRPTGQLLIGSSRQFNDTSPDVSYPILARMLQRAIGYLPALDQLAVIRVWTGFRAATPDGLPLIGRHPTHEGLWVATGHEGLGITTALATAKVLAAQLVGCPSEIPVAPYLPSRRLEMAHG